MISTRVSLLLSSIVALTLCSAQGQTKRVEIHGQVRYAQGSTPAEHVIVRLESYDGGGAISEAFTDSSGKFQFSSLPPAQYLVRVRKSGYRDAQQTLDLTTTSSGLVFLQLSPDASSSSTISKPGTIDATVPAAAQKEFDKGVTALAEGGKDKTSFAVKCFEKAISIHPKFVDARFRLGTAYMDLGQWDKAEQALLGTIEVDANASNALFALSEIYLQQNKMADAEKVLVKGLAMQDQSYFGHLNLARVYWTKANETKDPTVAKPALEKSYEEVKRALTLNPDLAGAHLLKGNLLLRAGRAADAMTEFNEYLRLEPNGAFATQTRTLIQKISRR